MSANYAKGRSSDVDLTMNNDGVYGNNMNNDETGSQNHAQHLPLSQHNISGLNDNNEKETNEEKKPENITYGERPVETSTTHMVVRSGDNKRRTTYRIHKCESRGCRRVAY